MNRSGNIFLAVCLMNALVACANTFPPDLSEDIPGAHVPGVVVRHIPRTENRYIGSPSICILPDGEYLASHDVFGPAVNTGKSGTVYVYSSVDKGVTWKEISVIYGQYWSNLFYHNGAVYILGVDHGHGNIVIRRSIDNGRTWSIPSGPETGFLFEGHYHTAPTPAVCHDGRIWRAFEYADAVDSKLPDRYGLLMISADMSSDLLNAANWEMTNCLPSNSSYMDGKFRGWLEGNAIVTKDGRLADMARVHIHPGTSEKAAIANVSADGDELYFQKFSGFVDFPGGSKKFTVRYDASTDRYLALVNNIKPGLEKEYPANVRNCLSLAASRDLMHWDIICTVLDHPDVKCHGFQYADWLIDGNDIIFLSRTGYDDEYGGPPRAHDANYLTFHRIENYKELLK